MPKIKHKTNDSTNTASSLSRSSASEASPSQSSGNAKLSDKAILVIQSADALNKQRDKLKIDLCDIINSCNQAIDEFFSAHDCIVKPVLKQIENGNMSHGKLVAIAEKTKLVVIHDRCIDSLLCLQQIRIKTEALTSALQTRDHAESGTHNTLPLCNTENVLAIYKADDPEKIATAKADFYTLLSYTKSEELFSAMTPVKNIVPNIQTASLSRRTYKGFFPAPPEMSAGTLTTRGTLSGSREMDQTASEDYDTVTVHALTPTSQLSRT